MMRRSEKMAPRNNGTLLVTALLLIAAISRGQAENVHQLSGSDITLSPTYRGDFKEITWLLNNNKLMDLELNETKEPIWYKSFPQLKAGASLNNQTGELTIPRLTIRDSGDYRAEVKLHDLTYHYTDITLTVQDPVVTPNIKKQTTKDWIYLSCESATPGVSYEWQDDKGKHMSNDKTYIIPTPTKAAVTLICIASNAVSEGRVSVTIEPPGPVVTPIITKHNTKDGITLSCESATPGVSYIWRDDKGDFVSDDKTYTIYKPDKLLTLTCIASNAVSEGSASVTFKPPDPVVTPIITNQTNEQWIQLSCESATPGVSYEWKDDKGDFVSDDKTYAILKPNKLLTLICIASNVVSERRVSVTFVPPDPVLTPIITILTNEEWIILTCESATPGVSYEWQDDEGDIVSDDKTYIIPKPTEEELTLTCIASNQVSKGRVSVTIVPPDLSGRDIAGIIGWIFVIILIVVIIFKKIRGGYRDGLSGWDIAEIMVGIFVIILIVVIIFEKITWRYRYGLSGWDIAEIIGWIFVILLIVVIIFKKIGGRYLYGRTGRVITGIFVAILIVVIVVEKIGRRYRNGLSGWDIVGIIVWIFVILLIVVIIFEKIRWMYRYGLLGRAINKCIPPFPYFPCCITALRVKQSTSYYDDLLTHIDDCKRGPCCLRKFAENKEGNLEKAEDLLRHISECTRTHCCIKDEVIAWINPAEPNNAEDPRRRCSKCTHNPRCIRDEENAEDNDTRPKAGEDNLKPDNEGNGTPEQQEILLENMGKVKGNKTGSREEV